MRLVFFDVETKIVVETNKEMVQGFRLMTANYAVYQSGGSFKVTQRQGFYKQRDFYMWFLDKVYPKTTLYALSANIWFDLYNSGLFLFLMDLGFKPVIFHNNGLCTIIKMVAEHGTIVFLNMQQLIPVSVKEYGAMIGMEKIEVDVHDPDDKKIMGYCHRDSDIITEIFRQWLDFVRIHDLGKFCFTLAAQGFTAFRHRFMTKPIYIHNNPFVTRFERKTYKGGRTECFKLGFLNEGMIYALDINSMYPYIMKTHKMPVKFVKTMEYPRKIGLHYWLHRYSCSAWVALNTDEPAYPMTYKKRLCFPTGKFATYLSHPELEYAFKRGHIRNIAYMICYEKDIIFDEYVKFFNALKQRYQAEGNKAYRFMVKRIMNSLYGKFGMRTDIPYFEDTVDNPEYSSQTVYDADTDKKYKQLILGKYRRVFEEGKGEYSEGLVAIPAYITSASRLLLWKLILKAGRENTFYCDTDSLFVNQAGYDALKNDLHDSDLGKLSLEAKSWYVNIEGPKDYTFGPKVKIKGVKVKGNKIKEGVYSNLQFPGMRSCMNMGITRPYVIKKITKRLKREYNKGVVGEGGSITPYKLAEYE